MSEKLLPSSPVFYDPRGRRWRHVKRTYLALGVIITALAAIFIASVLANPLLPTIESAATIQLAKKIGYRTAANRRAADSD